MMRCLFKLHCLMALWNWRWRATGKCSTVICNQLSALHYGMVMNVLRHTHNSNYYHCYNKLMTSAGAAAGDDSCYSELHIQVVLLALLHVSSSCVSQSLSPPRCAAAQLLVMGMHMPGMAQIKIYLFSFYGSGIPCVLSVLA